MCFTAESLTRQKLKYARHRNSDPDYIRELEEKLESLKATAYYQVSAFAHPELLVFTDDQPYEPRLFQWGLIPSWCKDETTAMKLSNQTLNARGETIFDKPAFRAAAKSRRCLVYLDGYYEYHHFKGKTYPFHIGLHNEEVMAIAGLWEPWLNKSTGEIIHTCTLVTTEANPLMARIHNNPKNDGARMPVILPTELQDAWLRPIKDPSDQQLIMDLIRPFDAGQMEAYPVGKLIGKYAPGNVPESRNRVNYPELDTFLQTSG